MTRKLHNALLAFSASGLMLVFVLMAAVPAQPTDAATESASVTVQDTPLANAHDVQSRMHATQAAVQARSDALEARIQARTDEFEAQIDRNTTLGDTLSTTAAFIAAVSTDTALNAAFDAVAETATDRIDRGEAEMARKKSHDRRVRSAMAVPYFSFAQGLRRGAGS